MSLIERNIDEIKRLCHLYAVTQLSVFGSVLTDRFDEESDVDFVVSFGDVSVEDYADNYLRLSADLGRLLGRDIDLIEDKAIRNPVFRANVDRTKVQIYGRV
ncbi:MAG: nucleotidyltransferase domain-containing protein [Bacteroidales bacterium]|nr:nucleotidyltransferase domain-containing protein [Bacteroidales bacterium]